MGISTLQSYRGAQVFEAIGLNKDLVDHYFTGTASRIEGVGLDVLADEAILQAPLRLPSHHAKLTLSWPSAAIISSASRRISPLQSAKLSPSCSTPCGSESFANFPGIHRPHR